MAVDTTYGQGGILLPGQIAAEQFNEITYYTQQYYTNQFPLMARVQRQPVRTQTFRSRHWKYRARKYGATSALNGTDTYSLLNFLPTVTTIGSQVGDDSTLMAGDVIEVPGTFERLEVLATSTTEFAALPQLPPAATALLPAGQFNTQPGQILVKRGVDSTSAAVLAAPTGGATTNVLTLVGNSRTGGEVFQSSFRLTPFDVTLQCQNFLYPVQVGGSDEDADILGVPEHLFAQVKQQQMQNMMYDMEAAAWFGNGEAIVANGVNRPKMIGVRKQSNVTFLSSAISSGPGSLTTPGQYTPQAFQSDVLLALYNQAAPPNVMFCSPQFLLGLDVWGAKAIRINAGVTELGIAVEAYNSTIAPGITIIQAPVLGTGRFPVAAWFGRIENLFYRQKRGERFQMRGIRGDAVEGEWLAEGAIENRDQEKSAWIEGNITFAPPY